MRAALLIAALLALPACTPAEEPTPAEPPSGCYVVVGPGGWRLSDECSHCRRHGRTMPPLVTCDGDTLDVFTIAGPPPIIL